MAGTVERTLALKLIADVGGINKGLGNVDRRLGRTARAAASWGKAFAGALVIGGIQRLADATVESIKAFREEQDAIRNFNITVKRMGVPVRRATQALDRMADRAIDLGFDDAQAIRGMDMFIRKTGDIEKATKLNALAMDISRAKGIDLAAAQKQVDQIYNGSARVLRAYGIEGKKGMEAVEAARKVERGKAAAWARRHPMEVLIGKISDGWADVVGNLSRGNFGAALKAGQKLITNIVRGIAGWTDKEGKRHVGLWDRLFDATPDKKGNPKGIINRLGADIGKELGKVDWGKSLGDALGSAFDGLKASIESGGLQQIAAVGGAIATAMFAVSFFLDAASAMFKAPGWLIKTGARKGLGAAVAIASTAVGKAFAAGVFLAHMFTSVATGMFKGITKIPAGLKVAVTAFGRLIGSPLGQGILLGVAAAFTANALLDLLAQKLDETFNTGNFTAARREQTSHGTDPLSMFARVLEDLLPGHAMGLSYVPHDNYPAMLHKGERVLTAEENRRGSAVNVAITVNAPVASDGYRVGQQIAGYLDQWASRGGSFRHLPMGAR